MPNPTISTITLPNSQTYDIKDAKARADIASITGTITGAMHFIGVSSTAITDGGTDNPTIDSNVYQMNGDTDAGAIAIYDELEFVWNGSKWQELGSSSKLGAMAYAETASATFQPQGTVSKPSFLGQESSVNITAATGGQSTNYTPAGTVSQPTFTNGSVTASGTFTPTGSVAVSTNAVENKKAAVSPAATGTATYTPSGSVTAPTISVASAGTTTTVNSITSVGSLPAWGATVTGENLTITWSQGALPTKGSDTTVKTGDASYSASAPTFSGDAVRLETGNIEVPSTYTASFTGTADQAISVSGTATGTVSQPTFTGTAVSLSGTTIAAGEVSQPAFTGSRATITVTPDA